MKYYLFLIIILAPFTAMAQGDSLNILARSAYFDGAVESSVKSFYTEAPSTMLYRSLHSLSMLNLGFDVREQGRLKLQQLGDDSFSGRVEVDSYLSMGAKSALWAKAHYKRGVTNNINWNSTSDYLLLYPHIVADSVGGDLLNEEYSFSGGYVRRIGRVNFAIEGDYRAGQEYRQIDPRPQNIISDFKLNLSAGVEVMHHLVGVDVSARLYKQDQSIKFYNPAGANTALLLMTGLGSYYARYSGLEESLIAYLGSGYSAALHIVPTKDKGWYGRLSYNNFNSERIYRPNNSIPVSNLITQQFAASTAYRAKRWSIRAGAGYELRQGIELVADRTGQGVIVDEQTMYNNNIYRADAGAVVEWQRAKFKYTLQPQLEFWQTKSTYKYPARSMSLSQIGGQVGGGVERLTEKWRLKAFVAVGYYGSPNEQLSLMGLEQPIADQLTSNAGLIAQNVATYELSIRTERIIENGLLGFVEVVFSPYLYSASGVEYRWAVNCGILF